MLINYNKQSVNKIIFSNDNCNNIINMQLANSVAQVKFKLKLLIPS